MRHAWMGLALLGLIGLGACKGGGEYVPPMKPLGEGMPADLPALSEQDFAAVRLTING